MYMKTLICWWHMLPRKFWFSQISLTCQGLINPTLRSYSTGQTLPVISFQYSSCARSIISHDMKCILIWMMKMASKMSDVPFPLYVYFEWLVKLFCPWPTSSAYPRRNDAMPYKHVVTVMFHEERWMFRFSLLKDLQVCTATASSRIIRILYTKDM